MISDKKYISKYISQLYRKSRIFVSKGVSQYDIGSGQLMFLIALYNKDGSNQEEITESLQMDKATTARALKKLEEENYIVRVRSLEDKRSNKIYLTEKSKAMKEEIYRVIDSWNYKLSESLSEEEEKTLKDLLEKVCKNINL